MNTDDILRRGTFLDPLPAAVSDDCARCGDNVADGTDGLCATCRDAAPETIVEMARAIGGWIPAGEVIPEAFEEVLANDGLHVWPAFVSLDGRWYWGPSRPLPDGHVVEWMPMPIPSARSVSSVPSVVQAP